MVNTQSFVPKHKQTTAKVTNILAGVISALAILFMNPFMVSAATIGSTQVNGTLSATTISAQSLQGGSLQVSGPINTTGTFNSSGVINGQTLQTAGLWAGTGISTAGYVSAAGNGSFGGTLSSTGGLTVASGGVSVTGNSTIAGTLSGLTGLTVASGGLTVTAGGVTITAGNYKQSVNTGMTALVGGAQAGTALNKDLNVVTTVATTADSVQLPVAVSGMEITIINRGTNSLNVFGQTGDGINAGGANAAYAVAANVAAKCYATGAAAASVWECQKTAR